MPNNLDQISKELPTLLDKLESQIARQTLDDQPLVKLPLKDSVGSLFDDVKERLKSEFDKTVEQAKQQGKELTAELIRDALFNALGDEGGLNLLQDTSDQGDTKRDKINRFDIQLPKGEPDSLQFSFKIGKTVTKTLKLTENLGLPNLGFKLRGGASAEVGLNLKMNFGLENATTTKPKFFVDLSAPDDFQATVKTELKDEKGKPLTVGGSLGVLELKATNNGSQFSSTFTGNLVDGSAAEGRLSFSELRKLQVDRRLTSDAALKFKLSTAPDLKLGIDNNIMPSFSMDLNLLDWKYDSGNSLAQTQRLQSHSRKGVATKAVNTPLVSANPQVELNNIQLDLGSFVEKFAGKILKDVLAVTGPIKGVTDKLNAKLPVIDRSLLNIARTAISIAGANGGKNVNEETQSLIDQLDQLVDLVSLVSQVASKPGKIPIDFGSFRLDQADAGASPVATRNAQPFTQQNKGNAAAFFNSLREFNDQRQPSLTRQTPSAPTGNLTFPILNDPITAVRFLLGQEENVSLFEYTTPRLRVGFDYTLPEIRIFGPIVLILGGGASASAQLLFGFDTEGLKAFQRSKFRNKEAIFDGLYVSSPKPNPGPSGAALKDPFQASKNVLLGGQITAEAGVSIGIASVSIGGGLALTAGFDIVNKDKNVPKNSEDYFKVRGREISNAVKNNRPFCLFKADGALSFIVFGALRLKFGFFSLTKRLNIANVNLIDFDINTGRCNPSQDYFDVQNPKPDPELQKKLVEQGIIDRQGTAKDDEITITHVADVRKEDIEKQNQERAGLAPLDPERFDGQVLLKGLPDPTDYSNVQLVILYGGEGNDRIEMVGIIASGQLDGGIGNDTLIGGKGDDFLTGGAGSDILDGGKGGIDTASYTDSTAGVYVNLNAGQADDGFSASGSQKSITSRLSKLNLTDRLKNIKTAEGSRFDDLLIANKRGSTLIGGDGNDQLTGDDGDDVLLGGKGSDFLQGGKGLNTTTYIDSVNTVVVNGSSRSLRFLSPLTKQSRFLIANRGYGGEAEGDLLIRISNIQGSVYDDILVGSDVKGDPDFLKNTKVDRRNRLDGLSGSDVFVAGRAAETLGSSIETQSEKVNDNDWVSYIRSTSGVSINLLTGTGSGGYAQDDKLVFVFAKEGKTTIQGDSATEHLEGSNFNDLLVGDADGNILRGANGNDTLLGGDGSDTLIGGAGADELDGQVDIDSKSLLATTDAYEGSAGDVASYADSAAGVSVNLQTQQGRFGDAEGDRLLNIENLIGSTHGDILTGDAQNNDIKPGFSNGEMDTVDGGDGGSDRLSIDYSLQDSSTYAGVFGGFVGDQRYLIRDRRGNTTQAIEQYAAGYRFLDRIEFSNIERLYISGTSKRDQLFGGTGRDIFYGNAGDDLLNGGDGDDLLSGDDGNDEINGGIGKNTIIAGDGNDVVSDQLVNGEFLSRSSDYSSTLEGGRGIDRFSVDLGGEIKNITFTSDDLTKESPSQSLNLTKGSISEFEIVEKIKTGSGNDNIVQKGRVNNNFVVGLGNDTVDGGLGIDTVDGGDGEADTLTIDYSVGDTGNRLLTGYYPAGTNFRSKTAFVFRKTEAGEDRIDFKNFEQFKITGTRQGEVLIGLGGLYRTRGRDTLTGGEGRDTFVLGDKNDTYYDLARDNDYVLITDFRLGEDVIEIRRINENGENALNYSLEPYLQGTITGTGIYRDEGAEKDLLAVLQGIRSTDVSLPDLNSVVGNQFFIPVGRLIELPPDQPIVK